MLEFIKSKVYNKYGNTIKSYYIISIADILQVGICLGLVAYFSDMWIFIVIGSIVMNILSNYSYHFHCKNLNYCTIITCLIFYIFGYISKQSPLWVAFLLCTFMIREMYIHMPLKIVNKHKSEEWHKKRFIFWVIAFLTMAIVLNHFNLVLLCSSTLWSLTMYGVLYFINENEFI